MSARWAVFTVAFLVTLGGAVLAAGQHAVSQKGKAFSTTALTIKPGDELVFKNDDDVTHNLFTNSKGFEFTVTQAPGDSARQTFKSEGVAEIRCAFHPRMKLAVTVKK